MTYEVYFTMGNGVVCCVGINSLEDVRQGFWITRNYELSEHPETDKFWIPPYGILFVEKMK